MIGNDRIKPIPNTRQLVELVRVVCTTDPFFPYDLYMVKLGLRLRALPKVKRPGENF